MLFELEQQMNSQAEFGLRFYRSNLGCFKGSRLLRGQKEGLVVIGRGVGVKRIRLQNGSCLLKRQKAVTTIG